MPFTLSSDIVNTTNFTSTPSTSTTVTIPTVKAGDFIRITVTIGADPGTNSITVSDPSNGTYTNKIGLFQSGDSQGLQHFYFANSVAATNLVVTASYSSINFVGVYGESWAGVSNTGFDKEAGQNQATPGTTTDIISSTAQTTLAADLILGACMDTNVATGSAAQVAGTGFANNTNGNQKVAMSLLFTNKVQSSAGSQAATFTDTTHGTTSNYITLMMTVSPALSRGAPVLQFVNRKVGPAVKRNQYMRKATPIKYQTPLSQQLTSALTATLSFIGALNTKTNTGLSGTLSFIGALNKGITKGLTATLSFAGSLVKQTSKLLSGTLSFIGNLASSHVTLVALTATLSFVGAFIKRPALGLSGTLSFIGAITKAITKGLSATLSFIGSLTKRTAKLLTGTLSFIGAMNASHLFIVALTATLSFVGSLASQFIAGTGAIVDYIVTFRRRRR